VTYLAVFAFIALLGAAMAYITYRRQLDRGRRTGLFSTLSVERALVAFEHESEAMGGIELEVEARWRFGDGDSALDANPATASFRVDLKVRSPSIPALLELEAPATTARGAPDWTSALLERLPARARESIEQAVATGGVVVGEGTVQQRTRVGTQERAPAVQRKLRERRDRAIAVARALTRLGPVAPIWLDEVCSGAEHWQRRLDGLEQLCRHYPEHELCRAACERALESGAQPEQLRAALFLGEAALRRLPRNLDPSLIPEALWAEALDVLPVALPAEQLAPLLARSLEVVSARVLRATLAGYKKLGEPPDPVRLGRLTKQSRDIELLMVAAEALGGIGDPSAEPALLDLFHKSGRAPKARRAELRTLLVNALGRSGSARAVPVLREAAEDRGVSAIFTEACSSAVTLIQARLQGVEPGGLALTETPEAGALAISDDGGELAVVEEGTAPAPDEG